MSAAGESILRLLLDKEERKTGPNPRPASANIAPGSLSGAEQMERDFYFKRAAELGAIRLRHGAGASRHVLRSVYVADRRLLASFLGLTPTPERVSLVATHLRAELADRPKVLVIVDRLEEAWSRRGKPYGLDLDKPDHVRTALVAFDEIVKRPRTPIDVRTFSIRHLGYSKAFDSVRAPVAALLAEALEMPGVGQEEILAVVGLAKLKHPVLVSGPIRLSGGSMVSEVGNYVGLPEDAVFELTESPDYVLTIENLASFHRYVSEIRGNRVIVYSGGYPSAGVMMFLRRLATMASGASWYHWGDIDEDGVRIFQLLERSLPISIQPHLMSSDLAERHGVPQVRTASRLRAEGAAAEMVAYLRGRSAKTLEQEALDPVSP